MPLRPLPARRRATATVALALAVVLAAACGLPGPTPVTPPDGQPLAEATTPAATEAPPAPRTPSPGTQAPPTPPPAEAAPTESPVVEVALRLVREVDDPATDGFEDFTAAVLTEARGWQQAGFRFTFRDDAPYTVVLAEGPRVDEICHPYTTGGRYSCQMGPVVALNADRWRYASDTWPDSLDAYRAMLVNHEVGHLIGQNHPVEFCEYPGAPAAVMSQQSGGLKGCTANPWPLDWEIACAARHDKPLAPGYEPDAQPICRPGVDRR